MRLGCDVILTVSVPFTMGLSTGRRPRPPPPTTTSGHWVAERESAIWSDRVKAGMARAARAGKCVHRQRLTLRTPAEVAEAEDLVAEGLPHAEVAARIGTSVGTLRRRRSVGDWLSTAERLRLGRRSQGSKFQPPKCPRFPDLDPSDLQSLGSHLAALVTAGLPSCLAWKSSNFFRSANM